MIKRKDLCTRSVLHNNYKNVWIFGGAAESQMFDVKEQVPL